VSVAMVPELRSLAAAARVGDLRGFRIERTQRSREARRRVVFMWCRSSGMFYMGLKKPGEASVVSVAKKKKRSFSSAELAPAGTL